MVRDLPTLVRARLRGSAASLVAVAVCLGVAGIGFGQDPVFEDPLFRDSVARRQALAASVITMSAPLPGGIAPSLMMLAPEATAVWPLPADPEPVLTEPPPLLADRMQHVVDGMHIPSAEEQLPPALLKRQPRPEEEHFAYTYVLYTASRVPLDGFARKARRDLTFSHLFRESSKYRGEVVHVEGRLKRLLRYDPPANAMHAGVKDLYEAWLFGDAQGADPTCLLMTEIPAAAKVGEKVDYRVAFDGYFFKRYRYKAADNLKENQYREAPLLIGRSFTFLVAPVEEGKEDGWAKQLLPLFIGVLLLTIGGLVGLAFWMRRNDRRVRARVSKLREATFVLPEPEEPTASTERPLSSRLGEPPSLN